MENAQRKKLVVELYERMQFAKFLSDSHTAKSWLKKEGFIAKNDFIFNPDYISNKQYFQIVQFRKFLNENPDLIDEEIRDVLNSNNKFSFLRKLDNLIPDFFDELKLHGTGYIATLYVDKKYNSENLKVPRI